MASHRGNSWDGASTDRLESRTAGFGGLDRSERAVFERLSVGTAFRRWTPPVRTQRHPLWPHPDHAYELDCLRGALPPGVLAAAERRSRKVGVGADQVLIQWGVISEDVYLRHLARHSGLAIERLTDVARRDCPLTNQQLHYAARHRIIPLRHDGVLSYVVVPGGFAARRICEMTSRFADAAPRLRLASRADLDAFLIRHGAPLARAAADNLPDHSPELSAAPYYVSDTPGRWRRLRRMAALTAILTLMPLFLLQFCGAVLALWFLCAISLRLAACLAAAPPRGSRTRLPDDELPHYTIVAALYRESASVAALVRSFEAFDYPREKLDIKLVIEADDTETMQAIHQLGPLPHVHVIVAPPYGPRTKPKALNYALSFARGTFIAVFDAEDRPDPGQLREALDAFAQGGDDLACVQASLCIDNTADGWLTRMFTAEYAGQFDVVLQGFHRFEMPLPLGGSSNHFRTQALCAARGWDAYNVTEDADLGFRLARCGFRSAMFRSTTYEEAPARFGAWLRQRSRWMKGWMQTWAVHMRSPRRLWREAGPRGFFALNLMVGGNVLTALMHPILLGEMLVQASAEMFGVDAASFLASNFADLHVTTIAAGYFSTCVIGIIGLARRGLLRESWVLLLTPIYWICLSIAAWRALVQLLTDPYRWEKTEHGLARHSRVGTMPARNHI